MNYNEAIDYIEECNKLGSVPGLESTDALAFRMGNPQNDLRFVHVAGTNGKGSTVTYLSNIMQEAGLKVGTYMSPTILDYRERWMINGRMMSKKKYASYIEMAKEKCDLLVAENMAHPTSFEIETVIAFKYFADEKCDIVILETGMGGMLDATNVVTTTIMEVFAHIDYDHMQFLGESLTQIATQKAGIIKNDTLVITGPQHEEVMRVLEDVCKEKNATLTVTGEYAPVKSGVTKQTFKFKGKNYSTPLIGSYQVDNAAVAVNAAITLSDSGRLVRKGGKEVNLTYDIICRGLMKSVLPARFQTVRKNPLLIIDGAHNSDAAMRLRETIDLYLKDKRKLYIIGMFRDKDVSQVVKTLIYDGDMVFTVAAPGNPRALSAVEMAEIVSEVNPKVTSCDSVEEAIELSTLMCDKDTVTIACGSLAYMNRVIGYFEK